MKNKFYDENHILNATSLLILDDKMISIVYDRYICIYVYDFVSVPIKREVGHQYRSLESKQETRRFLSSKYTKQRLCSLSPNEAQIRMQLELAKLQKKYRETKKELSRLSHRKYTSSSSATR